jgi:mortality factor 4-like protein 1
MDTLGSDFDLGYVYNELILGESQQEDAFQSKPMIKLPVPDSIKAILVDDWENVTKNQQLVPLPSRHPVNEILNDYLEFEKAKRVPGPDCAILEEVIAGLKEYFDKCLGRILLYR